MAAIQYVEANRASLGLLVMSGVALAAVVVGTVGWGKAWTRGRRIVHKDGEIDAVLEQRDRLERQVSLLVREILAAHAGPAVQDGGDPGELVRALFAWAKDEHTHGRLQLRDLLVRAALHVACQHGLIEQGILREVPPQVLQAQVREMLEELEVYGKLGGVIVRHAMSTDSAAVN